MTHHPVMFDTSPDGTSGGAGLLSRSVQPSLKTTLMRAVMVGFLGGVALIGLIENFNRFGDPASIHADRVAQTSPLASPFADPTDQAPAAQQDAITVPGSRADRLDFGMAPTDLTDLAAR